MSNLFITELQAYKEIVDKTIINERNANTINGMNYAFMEKYISSFFNYSNGGKRIRAYLVKLGYEMSNNKYDDRIILPSLSYEFFQTGVLIHDDIIDESTTRRGMPTMHIHFGNNHSAISKSICIGDIGILFSIDMIAKSNFDDNLIREAISHQNKVFELTISGELKDIELSEKKEYSLIDIIEMYKLKTSWYTIVGPLQLGAILGQANRKLLEQIKTVGLAMGIAFQIKDDILGIFGSENEIGKSNLSDMQEGKKTILTRHFLDNANEESIRRFNLIYGNNKSGIRELESIQQLFLSTDSLDYANNLCKKYTDEASFTLDLMDIDMKYKTILMDFLDYLQKRIS